jgi:peptidyl-prolyl cis-trans isomerase SurA
MRIRWMRVVPALLLVLGGAVAVGESAERIAAIVNKEVILESDVDDAVQQAAAQYRVNPQDSLTMKQLRQDVLKQLVDEQVILAEAARQNVTITPAEVSQGVDQQMAGVKARFPTTQDFEKALQQENLTEAGLRQKYEEDVRRQLLVMRMVNREVQSKTTVTDAEVRAYYDAHRDSLPKNPERLRLAAIVIAPEADAPLVAKGRAKADSLRLAIVRGKPFAEVAASASDDPSGARGGDLGTFTRGSMVAEFEDVAFSLKPNDLSQPFRTRFGWHLVQVVEHHAANDSLPERVHARHILVAVRPSAADEERARKKALGIRDSLRAGADFATLARRHSADTATRDSGGMLPEIALPDLPPTFHESLRGLGEGEVSVPLKGEAGYYVFRLLSRTPEKDYTFDEVKDRLKEVVQNQKLRENYNRWLDRIRKNSTVVYKD